MSSNSSSRFFSSSTLSGFHSGDTGSLDEALRSAYFYAERVCLVGGESERLVVNTEPTIFLFLCVLGSF